MKLYVDTNGKQVTVTKDPAEKVEQNGRQKTERGTGRLMWSTQASPSKSLLNTLATATRPSRCASMPTCCHALTTAPARSSASVSPE